MLKSVFLLTIGLAGGIGVGTAVAAFITLLDIIPRLAQLSNTYGYIHIYEKILIASIASITLITFLKFTFQGSKLLLVPIGLIMGIFVGLLAAALAEVVNVIPVLVRRLTIEDYVQYALIALALGKVMGSLVQWILLNKYY